MSGSWSIVLFGGVCASSTIDDNHAADGAGGGACGLSVVCHDCKIREGDVGMA